MFSFLLLPLYFLLAPMPSISTLDNGHEHREISQWDLSNNS